MKKTEQNIIEETKIDNEITELTDNELETVVGGTTCVCSVQPLPNGTEPPNGLPPDADLAAKDIMKTKQGILQQVAQAMHTQANSNAANILGLLK